MATQPQPPDTSAIKEPQQKTWTSGNDAMVGNLLVVMGEQLCEAVDLRAGEKVLDVATGSGNTALSAARRFCQTTGIDYVPELIEQAKSRAQAERLEVSFEVGDAESLPYADASFDVVLSTLGVMFAPNQEKAASEMLRVCRPGARSAWPDVPHHGQARRSAPGHKAAPLWGTEERVRELLGEGVSSLEATRKSYAWRYPSAESFVEYFREYYGPTLKAFESLDEGGQEALARDLEELLEEWNTSGNETLLVWSDYLEVVAVRR